MPDLFIGLVSHSASRFAWNQGESGLAYGLQRALRAAGRTSEVRINVENLFDPSALSLTPEVIQESTFEELSLERAWGRFLSAGSPQRCARAVRQELLGAGRWLNAQWRLRGPRMVTGNPLSAQERAIRRLLNIELSHFDLLECAIESGAPWTLILEDDASTLDLEDAVLGLIGIMDSRSTPQPRYVNISESFTQEQLGIAHLLLPTTEIWQGTKARLVLPSKRPVTNTVCAILYRTDFISDLLSVMRGLPQVPVIPIDWKVNQALMHMFDRGSLGAGDCWSVFPGPFTQLSMNEAIARVNGAGR